MLVSFGLAQPLLPAATSLHGNALAQMMPDELMAKNLGSKEERMKKSSIDGPGMKSLGPNDPQWCRPCHLNHDKVRASRAAGRKAPGATRTAATAAAAAASASAAVPASAATPPKGRPRKPATEP
jgi:hypothetical protein